ncbi:DUF239-domain-containing protein [Penicillium daleae]|uniref:DUF239-domain-containing protein n=1 Tax=Penicillium daleae TaxID=63821 RepID=A0AAD6C291_9EURO|nr:DUF239-domain-containing protein [Penicillium daleae]KAJ5443677.1 DUF239-domain-containing protein [Penicillium daleae]
MPILRQDLKLLSDKQTLEQCLTKPPPPPAGKEKQSPWPHWYSSTSQKVKNIGTQGGISCYKAAVQNPGDFSLLQTAVIRTDVPTSGNPSKLCHQTIEVGWINFPTQVAEPHLFTFYNTNGYTEIADYKGGWNTEVKGWVQYDHTIFPGAVGGPLCVDGGLQTEMPIRIQLYQGNWWVYVADRWIGYYPASLFSTGEADPSQTLAQGSNQVNWYGEVYQTDIALTTTDMGSGEWPWTRWSHSAFMKNITYLDADGVPHGYYGTQHSFVSDEARYNMEPHYDSGTAWGSYMWIGGPGAGGKIGAVEQEGKGS